MCWPLEKHHYLRRMRMTVSILLVLVHRHVISHVIPSRWIYGSGATRRERRTVVISQQTPSYRVFDIARVFYYCTTLWAGISCTTYNWARYLFRHSITYLPWFCWIRSYIKHFCDTFNFFLFICEHYGQHLDKIRTRWHSSGFIPWAISGTLLHRFHKSSIRQLVTLSK